jgi:hypothetical protein
MQPDSVTRGARFLNVTATVADDMIRLSGAYEAPADLIPVLLFSVGVPWAEPCARHVCCLWDVAERYRDHDLMTALGPTCDEKADLRRMNLMKGNAGVTGRWNVSTLIHPSFVAMLFLAPSVFYMYHEIVPLQWADSASVHWQSSWYGQPCHPVTYPDGRQVCIYCANAKPANAVYVFSANWFTTFQCPWVCKPGFIGPGCDVAMDALAYGLLAAATVLCLAALVAILVCSRRVRPAEAKPPPQHPPPPAPTARPTAEMITFKDLNFAQHEIRIKLL